MNRRKFLKVLGGGVAVTAAVAAGCKHPNETAAEGTQLGEETKGKMTYRKDAHGEEVSLIGYGCMRLPTVNGQKDGEYDQEAVNSQVDYALEHGINYFDTAPVYCKGQSEGIMGKALSRHPRERYKIATKMSNVRNTSRKDSIDMYRNSLKQLRTDYIDYYLLHSIGGGDDPLAFFNERFINNGVLEFLLAEREAGRIKNLGFSFHGAQSLFDHALAMHDTVKWDFVQIEMNYVDWNHAHELSESNVNAKYLYEELDKREIPAVIMEPLLGGQLANSNGQFNDHMVRMLKEREPQMSIASWAFRFCGTFPRVLTALSGMTYMENIKENIRTCSPLKPLNEEELAMLEEIAKVYVSFHNVPCTGCQYCMPCPYGLDIPGNFAFYNKALNAGNVNPDRQSPEYSKARRAFLVGYDRAVEPKRQASHCIGCGACMTHCPQGIKIPEEMAKIDQFAEQLKINGKLS
ncbi:MAG: aldo/keto reductase [Bacteroidales bacterium]|nr:aldo/keto reductase [Bacteroidales bacterium]